MYFQAHYVSSLHFYHRKIQIQLISQMKIHLLTRTRDLSHRSRENRREIPPPQHPARLLTPVAAGKSEALLFGEFQRTAHARSWLALTCLTPLLLLEILFLTLSDIFALYFFALSLFANITSNLV